MKYDCAATTTTTNTIITIITNIIIITSSPDMPGSIVASLDKFARCRQYPTDIHVHILRRRMMMHILIVIDGGEDD